MKCPNIEKQNKATILTPQKVDKLHHLKIISLMISLIKDHLLD